MFDFVPSALRNLIHRPATRLYPKVVRKPFAGARGHIEIAIESCIFCGMCSRRCPVGALKVDRAQRTWVIDRFHCVMCGECVSCCPKKCLASGEQYTPPAGQKTKDAFVLEVPAQEPQKKDA